MSHNYRGHEVGDVVNNRTIIELGWNARQGRVIVMMRCLKCNRIAKCHFHNYEKNCRLCRHNSLRTDKEFHRASL